MVSSFPHRSRQPAYRSEPFLPDGFERLPCHFQTVAVYGTTGCRRIQEIVVDVREISREELVIDSALCGFLPNSFTLILGAGQIGLGCTVYRRGTDRLHCRLIRRESKAMVAFLSSLSRPEATLSEIGHWLFPRSRQMRKFAEYNR